MTGSGSSGTRSRPFQVFCRGHGIIAVATGDELVDTEAAELGIYASFMVRRQHQIKFKR